jgi:uncharacterized protein YraI
MATMSVQVRSSQLRATPSFLGQVLAQMAHGDQVTMREQRGDWVRVQSGTREGWMHSSALTTQTIVLNPGSSDVERAASSSEIALAGKGFSASVEAEYRRQNRGLNYGAVDRMESRKVSVEDLSRFVRDGGLTQV